MPITSCLTHIDYSETRLQIIQPVSESRHYALNHVPLLCLCLYLPWTHLAPWLTPARQLPKFTLGIAHWQQLSLAAYTEKNQFSINFPYLYLMRVSRTHTHRTPYTVHISQVYGLRFELWLSKTWYLSLQSNISSAFGFFSGLIQRRSRIKSLCTC